jgi:Holliday junction DNA helicase RuvA
MIEYIKGELAELTPALAVVEAGGVGYASTSRSTPTRPSRPADREAAGTRVDTDGRRDDNYTLYGFATQQERELYRLLISVSGVGANTARTMLSSLTPGELCNAIANGDERLIKGVKGIGLKTAQRIIVDLKDKIMSAGIAAELHVSATASAPAVNTAVKDEAVSAMTMLGFSPAPVAKVVTAILTEQPDLAVELVVKEALKRIK